MKNLSLRAFLVPKTPVYVQTKDQDGVKKSPFAQKLFGYVWTRP